MERPEVLMVDSNAGGVGKSTIARELAHLAAMQGKKTLLIDLDPSPSQHLLHGITKPDSANSIVRVLQSSFDGKWPLNTISANENLDLCFSSTDLERELEILRGRSRMEYVLKDVLADFPTGHELIILDCPGSRTLLNRMALAAATKVLIVIEPETKSANGLIGIIAWLGTTSRGLRLDPEPEILGILPSKVNLDGALQRGYMEELKEAHKAGGLGQYLFEGIPHSKYVANSIEAGKPMRSYRSGWQYNKRFDVVLDRLFIGVCK